MNRRDTARVVGHARLRACLAACAAYRLSGCTTYRLSGRGCNSGRDGVGAAPFAELFRRRGVGKLFRRVKRIGTYRGGRQRSALRTLGFAGGYRPGVFLVRYANAFPLPDESLARGNQS